MSKISCININNKEYKALVEDSNLSPIVVEFKIAKWQSETGLDRFPSKDELMSFDGVSYNLKAVDILSSDKAIQVFKKGNKNNWELSKILTELQIPKEQKQLILDKGLTNKDEIILALLADNSFAVEINIATTKSANSVDDYDTAYEQQYGQGDIVGSNTQHYSNLTVPGGINYTENEISTPAITPNIKGHAQFSTNQGIGWFRSDEQKEDSNLSIEKGRLIDNKIYTKTRRILELQSDLFQKGRDSKLLVGERSIDGGGTFNIKDHEYKRSINGEFSVRSPEDGSDTVEDGGIVVIKNISESEYFDALRTLNNTNEDNQFLQLLNKKGNWVNFFIQSIVQDSIKKGYKKVLFPTGNTAATVEGHTTIADDIKNTNKIIKILEDNKVEKNPDVESPRQAYRFKISEHNDYNYAATQSEAEGDRKAKIDYLKYRNKERKEQGVEKLAPIEAFYNNKVTRTLDKLYAVNKITDKYGNTWNEIDLSQDISQTILLKDLLNENIKDRVFENNVTTPTFNNDPNLRGDFVKTMRLLFNNKTSNVMATDVLENILNNFEDISDISKPVLEKVLKKLQVTNAKVLFVGQSKMATEGAVMQYNPHDKTIRVSKKFLTGLDPKFLSRVFIHEVVHSVTHHVITKPTTMEDKIFGDFIKKSYDYYKSKIDNADSYNGFKNIDEFMADFFTDKDFANKIKEVDKKNKNKSFLSKLISYLKTLFGINKNETPAYNKVMDSILSNAKVDVLNKNWNDVVFEKNITEIPAYYKLGSIDKKLNYFIDGIKDNLEENIRNYDNLIKKVKKPQSIKLYNDKLKELLFHINELDEGNKWQGISLFVNQMNNSINSLKAKLHTENFQNKDVVTTINLYNKYLESYDIIEDIRQFLSDTKAEIKTGKENIPVTLEDIIAINDVLEEASGQYNGLKGDVFSYLKKAFIEKYNKKEYATEVLYKYRKKLGKQYKDLKITESKKSWVAKQMNGPYKEEIAQKVKEHVTGIVEDHAFDITTATAVMNTSINTNSKLVQMLHNLIAKTRDVIITKTRKKDLDLISLHDKFIKDKGNKKPSALYSELIEYDKVSDNYYLKGEYSIKFKQEHDKQFNKYIEELKEIATNKGTNSDEYKYYFDNSNFNKWLKDNVVKQGDVERPSNKWKNDLSKLSNIEKQVLNEFTSIIKDTQKKTFKINSLISRPLKGAVYMKLPSITKKDLERALEGNIKGFYKDKIKDLTKVRVDDIGYETKLVKMNNKPLNNVKINFRGDLSSDQQSLDLFTIMALEYKNGINYEEKHKLENDAHILKEIAKNKKYYVTSAASRVPILGAHIKRNKRLIQDGSTSNTYKRINSLIESNVYDILHKNSGKIGKYDVNKIIGFVNGWTGAVGMTLNEVTATANVLNGKAQLFLEAISGSHIKAKSIAKAEKLYFSNLGEIVKDIKSPVKRSFTNQLTEMFDTFGTVSVGQKQAFIKNTMIKAIGNFGSGQFMQDSGEHWMQSVLTMGVLDSVKVMNSDHNFIDKNGKVVKTEKEAASLLDMISLVNGELKVSKKFLYTSHTPNVAYNEGGKELIDKFLKKKIFDTMGAYDVNMQPEAQRHAFGKLTLMYRKFLVPMGVARYRGFSTFNKSYDELRPEQKFFSEALQEYEEGYYTSALRFVSTTALPALKELNYKIIKENWSELTDYQKKNIHKAVTEVVITAVLLPLLSIILQSMADDTEDDEFLYFLLLEFRRLESELSSYRNLSEQWRILESPIPSARMVQNSSKLILRLINPSQWGERYKSGTNKNMFRIKREVERLTPILNSRSITYKDKYNYMLKMVQ